LSVIGHQAARYSTEEIISRAFAQPCRCVDEEDAAWSTVGVVTDKESVLLVPVDGGVGDTDLVG
jgi:hypothetical protein